MRIHITWAQLAFAAGIVWLASKNKVTISRG